MTDMFSHTAFDPTKMSRDVKIVNYDHAEGTAHSIQPKYAYKDNALWGIRMSLPKGTKLIMYSRKKPDGKDYFRTQARLIFDHANKDHMEFVRKWDEIHVTTCENLVAAQNKKSTGIVIDDVFRDSRWMKKASLDEKLEELYLVKTGEPFYRDWVKQDDGSFKIDSNYSPSVFVEFYDYSSKPDKNGKPGNKTQIRMPGIIKGSDGSEKVGYEDQPWGILSDHDAVLDGGQISVKKVSVGGKKGVSWAFSLDSAQIALKGLTKAEKKNNANEEEMAKDMKVDEVKAYLAEIEELKARIAAMAQSTSTATPEEPAHFKGPTVETPNRAEQAEKDKEVNNNGKTPPTTPPKTPPNETDGPEFPLFDSEDKPKEKKGRKIRNN
jgi:hypothetical protein